MKHFFLTIMIAGILPYNACHAQYHQFDVKKARFSSSVLNEFSPVWYRGGLVFCSDLRDNSLAGFVNGNKRLLNIVCVPTSDENSRQKPVMFSDELRSGFNDGPASFSPDGNTIFYSRNTNIESRNRNTIDTSNHLGIFTAKLTNGKWSDIKPFEYNNPWFDNCMPAVSPDGSRIYFASDMPGGYGGMDLYYCDSVSSGWSAPVNMGKSINTPGNESFPFATDGGLLFFSSDGLKGFGKKDIFYSYERNGKWINPIHLDSEINSAADDFGIVTGSGLKKGFFSTNRRGTDDIFSFHLVPPEFASCDTLKENNYCFTFYDEHFKKSDSLSVMYIWDFGNGIIKKGEEVRHCFNGPGNYSVRLSIRDSLTGKDIVRMTEYKVKLDPPGQPSINSFTLAPTDKSLDFTAVTESVPGFTAARYFWDFGDGFVTGEQTISRTFDKPGLHFVRMGMIGKADSLSQSSSACVVKSFRIIDKNIESVTVAGIAGTYVPAAKDSVCRLKVRLFRDKDLTEAQKIKISECSEGLTIPYLFIDKRGLFPSAFRSLDKIASLLKDEPGIRLEIAVQRTTGQPSTVLFDLSEKWAQEIAAHMRWRNVGSKQFGFTGTGPGSSFFIPVENKELSTDGEAEFIFTRIQ